RAAAPAKDILMTASPARFVANSAAAGAALAPVSAASAPARVGWLPPGVAFYLQVSILVFFIAGSSAPTPLYAVYQAAWGFSPITITVVFGVYALAVLAALLVFGSLSDHIGRRPVLLGTTLVHVVAMALFAAAHDVAPLPA